MAERPKTESAELPLDLRRSSEPGIPLDIISDLFTRIRLPHELQSSFWGELRERALACISGKVSNVKTHRNGDTTVIIDSTATGGAPKPGEETPLQNFFYGPAEITDAQLAELKRAQSARLCVTVCFQTEGGKRIIESVDVFECPS